MSIFRLFSLSTILFVFLASFIFSMPTGADSNFIGIWQGNLNAGGSNLKIVFHISGKQDSLKGTLDSPDQGAFGIPVSSIIISQDSIRLNVQVANGYYIGKIDPSNSKISGAWNQNGFTFPLDLNKTTMVEEVKRPQEPKKPYPYKEEDVKFQNKKDNITLAGTLTLPDSGRNFPAVILITGSGPQDRNETIMNHRPFLVLADYLTKKRIAVLRYDDRGFGQSQGNFSTATTEDFVTDALSAVDYLLSRGEVNKNEIGLIGHSEGGLIAPLASLKSDKVSFIVLMAGPGLPGEDILKMQTKLIMKSNGVSDSTILKTLDLNTKAYELIKTEKDSLRLHQELERLYDKFAETLPENEKQMLGGNPKKFFEAQINTITTPWFKFFLSYDPRPALKKIKIPVLEIIGEKDLQVPPKENLTAVSNALKEGGNKNYKVEELKGLNHLFQVAGTGAISEYGKIDETISPTALDTIVDWILRILKD